jgi:hypothetical protein
MPAGLAVLRSPCGRPESWHISYFLHLVLQEDWNAQTVDNKKKNQPERLDEDFEAGRIDRDEYEQPKDEIEATP